MHIIAFMQQQEDRYKSEWEQTRSICFTVAKFSGNMRNSGMNITQFWRFPWDTKNTTTGLMWAAKQRKLRSNGRNDKPSS